MVRAQVVPVRSSTRWRLSSRPTQLASMSWQKTSSRSTQLHLAAAFLLSPTFSRCSTRVLLLPTSLLPSSKLLQTRPFLAWPVDTPSAATSRFSAARCSTSLSCAVASTSRLTWTTSTSSCHRTPTSLLQRALLWRASPTDQSPLRRSWRRWTTSRTSRAPRLLVWTHSLLLNRTLTTSRPATIKR